MWGRQLSIAVIMGMAVIAGQLAAPVASAAEPSELTSSLQASDFSQLRQTISKVKLPAIAQPAWVQQQLAAEEAARASAQRKAASTITVSYDVMAKGVEAASLADFRQQANETLNDNRGWARMNVVFKEVAGGGRFTLVLSAASEVPSFSSGCSSEYSCRVGQYIIINQDRWNGATDSWNQAGGSLRDYRHMVINHEVGHWLGHGHPSCSGAGRPAPVMLQQSIDLQGCSFNPWPLPSELYSTQLGIV